MTTQSYGMKWRQPFDRWKMTKQLELITSQQLIKHGGETVADILTAICNKIWQNGEWPIPWTQSLIITLPKKGNLQLCQNYRTISLISHASKVILNRLKPQAEEINAEEQAGFRSGRSTTEQIFNLRILCEKYSQHQQDIYHVFIDFKKAFDRVWYDALWDITKKYNMGQKLINIMQLYAKASSAVLVQGTEGDWFHTSVGVRQGCLLSPTLFNIYFERIMTDALEDHHGTISIGGRIITNLRFADDIDGLAGDEEEFAALVNRLDRTSSRFGMEINAEKTKLMTNSATPKLETVNQVPWSHTQWRRIKDRGFSKSSTDSNNTGKAKTLMDRQEHLSPVKIEVTPCISLVYLPVRMWVMDTDSRTAEKDPGSGNEVFQETPWHLIHRPHHKRRSEQNDLTACEALWRPPDHSEDEKTEVVWTCDTNQWNIKEHPPRDSSREEEARQTEEEVDRQHCRMDREELAETQALAYDRKRWRTLVHRSSMQCPYDPGGLRDSWSWKP